MSTRPTDLELMAFADGELDEPRRAEVQAFVASSPEARAKLATMAGVGDVVRDLARERADAMEVDVADAIFDRIDREATPAAPAMKLPRIQLGSASPPSRRSANENAFRIFSLAAAAVAVAAGVTIWARTEPGAPLAVPTGAVSMALTASPSAVVATPAHEAESEVGASVAAVDFGSNTGSIFYVPTGVAMTTVVWVAETGPGEQ